MKNIIGQQKQYFPLLQKLFKLFLSDFWALILNLCTYLLQKLKFLNYIFTYTTYSYMHNKFENSWNYIEQGLKQGPNLDVIN